MIFSFFKKYKKIFYTKWIYNKKNKDKYNYIINNVYKLPFIDNINKIIDKEVNKLFKKISEYSIFNKYFLSTWSKYFKNGSLCLKNVNIKIRTNNSLENFNRRFKNLFIKKNNIEPIIYVDNLIAIAFENKDFYLNQINKKSKFISKNKIYKINKNYYDLNKEEQNVLFKELEIFDEELIENPIINDIPSSDINLDNKEIENNIINNEDKFYNNYKSKNNDLNNSRFLYWKDNSCSFDSFICIFIYTIQPFAHVLKTNKNFELFIKFIKFINNHNFNKESIFFMKNMKILIKLINVIYLI